MQPTFPINDVNLFFLFSFSIPRVCGHTIFSPIFIPVAVDVIRSAATSVLRPLSQHFSTNYTASMCACATKRINIETAGVDEWLWRPLSLLRLPSATALLLDSLVVDFKLAPVQLGEIGENALSSSQELEVKWEKKEKWWTIKERDVSIAL